MRRMRRARGISVVGAVAALAGALVLAPTSDASNPPAGTISPSSPTATWSGSFLLPNIISPPNCDPNFCDTFALTVDLAGGTGDLEIVVNQAGGLALPFVSLRDASGAELDDGSGLGQATITYDDIPAGTYSVEVTNGDLLPGGSYQARATLTPGPPPIDPAALGTDSVAFTRDDAEPVASATVPLRVVLVGFEEGSMTEEQVFSQIPDFQRVGSLYTYDGGLRSGDDGIPSATLLNHGRLYYDQEEPFLLPIEYRWEPELHYAPSEFAAGLFAHMVADSTTGDYADPLRRVYLDTYNLTRGLPSRLLASGGDPATIVPPLAPVRFVDGESTEDWVAANSEALLGFPAGREPGEAGYTVFVLNTWDAPEASVFPKDEYHVFKIDRTDPDRGDFDGIDWARVWGGRYRFMMVDLGAAPNPYESETWANRGRSVLGSALHDPPIWEMRAGLPWPVDFTELLQGLDGITTAIDPTNTLGDDDLVEQISRLVNEAVNFRFFHSYLYEPRPGTGRFFLSDNVWHDRIAIYRSDLTKLYDQEAALNGLRTLTPYFEFDGDVQYQYLEQITEHPEYAADQAALDEAKGAGDDLAGIPHLSMNTASMMDYIDSNPERFLRGGACATTIPTIQVVVPGHYAWALPIASGIATNRNGVPWGFLNAVNDVTKWNGADKDQSLVLAHPNILFNSAFTYTTIHEASHYLGLAHPHDTVGAVRGPDGSPRYYDGFTWTFNTTAAPTTYSHVETTYSILDQESIARGHLGFYLEWTFDALEDAGAQLVSEGVTTVGQLDGIDGVAAANRVLAIQRAAEAQELFAGFDFVRATFAAQEAWRAAASFRDSVFDLEPGTSQLDRGTQHGTNAELAAAGCPVAAALTDPIPDFDPGDAPTAGEVGGSGDGGHSHGPGGDGGHVAGGVLGSGGGSGGGALPATGGGGAPLLPLVLALAAVLTVVAKLTRRPPTP